jgi:cell wall-associated NlpC family hydrolase
MVAEYLLMNNTPAPANTTPADEPITGAAPATLTIGGWATVINTFSTPGLRLRSAPAPWEELLAVIPEGSLLRIVSGPTPGGNGNPWFEVSADGKDGWVDSTYLEPAATPTGASSPSASPAQATSATGGLAAGAWAEVNGTTGTSGLRLRAAPSPWEKLLAILPEGTKLKILEGPARGGNGEPWYRVAWDGSWGWVAGTYLIPTTAPAGAPVTPTTATAPVPGTGNGAALVQLARAQVGKPYVWGATGPDTFDCSGLVAYVARKALGLTMPRVAADQAFAGVHVDYPNLTPGDLVFYANTYQPGISHVGIYIGNSQWVTASDETTGVIIASMDEPYWKSRYAGARRIT